MPRDIDDEDDRIARKPRDGDRPARRGAADDDDDNRFADTPGADRPARRRPARYADDDEPRPRKKLGSLSQEARLKEIKTAGWIMLVVGLLTIGANLFMLFKDLNELASIPAPKAQKDAILGILYLIYGAFFVLGAVFVVFSFVVRSYPVPITIAALILYLCGNAFGAVLAPESLVQGLIMKIIIVVCLVKAIQAAFAYSKEENRSASASSD